MPFKNEKKIEPKSQFIEDTKQKRQEKGTYVEVSTLSSQMSQHLASNACCESQTDKQKPACFEDESLNIFDHIWKHAQVTRLCLHSKN